MEINISHLKPVRVNQRVRVDVTGEIHRVHRLANFTSEGERYCIDIETPWDTAIFRTCHLWFWARGLTPEPLCCCECWTDKEVRVYPSRFAPYGARPYCPSCKAAAISNSLSTETPT